MGKTAKIVGSGLFLLGGAAFFDYASMELGLPGLKEYAVDMIHAFADMSPAQALDIAFTNLGDHMDYFLEDKFGALGTASQVGMYGGLTGLIYNAFKREKPETIEKTTE